MADSDEYTGLVPDSELDPPIGAVEKFYVIQDGATVGVLPNDWVDLDETIPADPIWGSSFQVYQCFDEYITVRMLEPGSTEYKEIAVTPEWILNNYRRVTKEYP